IGMNRPVTSRSVPVAMVATKKNMPKQRPRCTAASMDLCTYQRNSQPSSPQYSASTTAIVGGTNGTGDPSGSTSLDVPTLAQMYNFPNTGAANQTIALLALLSDLTRLPSSHEDVYIRASDGLVTRPVAGYVYSANWETCTGGICTR